MTTTFQAIIIGSGQAGNPLAHKLADEGWQVALIERGHLGGSCVNYGCTPTKTMLASAKVAHQARRAGEFGVKVPSVNVDMPQVIARKDKQVQGSRDGLKKKVDQRLTLTLYEGEAHFTGAHSVSVNGETLTADHIFINTGTSPTIPKIEGLKDVPYLTNESIIELEEIPAHLLILGGSYIGLEFGQMFRRFGSNVTIIESEASIIVREDDDISAALHEILTDEGIEILTNTEITHVEKLDHEIRLTAADGKIIQGTHLLIAVGRTPNSKKLDLAAAGIETDKKGYIAVDEYFQTNVKGVYALGEINGEPQFTHIASHDHTIVLHNLLHQEKKSTKGRVIPYALFTDPELGRVGLGEKEAAKQGKVVKIGKVPMTTVSRAHEQGESAGLMKILVDPDTDQILGAAILGASGGEVVQVFLAMMLAKAPWTVLDQAQFIHPTLVEGIYGLLDSIE